MLYIFSPLQTRNKPHEGATYADCAFILVPFSVIANKFIFLSCFGADRFCWDLQNRRDMSRAYRICFTKIITIYRSNFIEKMYPIRSMYKIGILKAHNNLFTESAIRYKFFFSDLGIKTESGRCQK